MFTAEWRSRVFVSCLFGIRYNTRPRARVRVRVRTQRKLRMYPTTTTTTTTWCAPTATFSTRAIVIPGYASLPTYPPSPSIYAHALAGTFQPDEANPNRITVCSLGAIKSADSDDASCRSISAACRQLFRSIWISPRNFRDFRFFFARKIRVVAVVNSCNTWIPENMAVLATFFLLFFAAAANFLAMKST